MEENIAGTVRPNAPGPRLPTPQLTIAGENRPQPSSDGVSTIPAPTPPRSTRTVAAATAPTMSASHDRHRRRSVSVDDHTVGDWAPETIQGYARDWRGFAAWCRVRALNDPLEATERDVADYVASMVRDRFAFATIRRRLSGIAFNFGIVERQISPTRSDLVRDALDRAARTLGTAPRRAEPLSLNALRRVIVGLPIVRPATNADVVHRDRLLLGLGWAAALRAGELVALDVDDIDFIGDPDSGVGGMKVRIRKPIRNQEQRSESVAVPYSALSSTCPVRMTLSATRRAHSGPLFRHIDRHGKAQSRLRSGAVSRIVKSAVADVLQLDPALCSSHSLRMGFFAEARRNGVPEHLIAYHARHKNEALHNVHDRPGEWLSQPALAAEWW